MIPWATMLTIVAATAGQPPDTACPTRDAVVAELERLGTAPAVAALGLPEVMVRAGRMQVALRGLDGRLSGAREVAAPATCSERAAVAATLLSAWVGAWNTGGFSEPLGTASRSAAPATSGPTEQSSSDVPVAAAPILDVSPTTSATADPLPPPTSAAVPTLAAPTPTTASPVAAPATAPSKESAGPVATSARLDEAKSPGRRAFEIGGFGFGVHDGDAGAWGGGLQMGYRLAGWLGIDAVLSGIDNRERALPPGTAAYRSYGLALGPNLRARSKHLFGDLALLPEVTLLAAEGRRLNPGNRITRWGLAADARLRLGVVLGAWRPFVFAAGSVAIRAERLNLEDHAEQGIDLSRWNAMAGVGLSYFWGSAD